MKNVKENLNRGSEPLRVLSANELRHAAGGADESGTKRPASPRD